MLLHPFPGLFVRPPERFRGTLLLYEPVAAVGPSSRVSGEPLTDRFSSQFGAVASLATPRVEWPFRWNSIQVYRSDYLLYVIVTEKTGPEHSLIDHASTGAGNNFDNNYNNDYR
jgi:hypothetical protein